MEIMGYATLSAVRQHACKYALRQVLKTHEEMPPSLRPQLRDTPTGVQMVFLSSPAHTCLFALSVLQALGIVEPLQPASLNLSDIRMGLHFGMVHEATDMEMRTCYLGEGIKTSVQMVQGAASGQALASTAFFDALEHMAGDTGGLFKKAVGLAPTGGGPVQAYPLSSNTTAFALLEHLVQRMPACNAVTTENAVPVAQGSESELNKNIQTVQSWLTPVNVLVTFGTFLMTLIGRFTDQARAMTTIAAALLMLGLVLALLWLVQRTSALHRLGVRYPQRLRALVTGATTSLVLTASGAMALAAWITTKDATSLAAPAPALASVVPTQTSHASLPVAPPDKATAASPSVPAIKSRMSPEPGTTIASGSKPAPSVQVPPAAAPQPVPVAVTHAAVPESGQQPDSAKQGATARMHSPSVKDSGSFSGQPSDYPIATGKTAVRQVLVARRPAPEAAAPTRARVRPERCALILQKASIDEPISQQEKNFLSTACH